MRLAVGISSFIKCLLKSFVYVFSLGLSFSYVRVVLSKLILCFTDSYSHFVTCHLSLLFLIYCLLISRPVCLMDSRELLLELVQDLQIQHV